MCSSGTEVEELREQESVSRVLADLLENQEELFDSDEEDDVSTTNDYSSVNEQVRRLLLLLLLLFHSLSIPLFSCIWKVLCKF